MKNKISKFVRRPWGGFEVVEQRSNYWLKKLYVKAGEAFSLQSHKHRLEIWVVLKGRIKAVKGKRSLILKVGDSIAILPKEKHRILGVTDACIFEAAFGKPLENDIIRYEDKYGRV